MKRWLCLLLLLPFWVQAEPGDERYLTAREAFRTGDRPVLARVYNESLEAAHSQAHVLDAWVAYLYLRQQLLDGDATGIPAFLQQQDDDYLVEKLRGDWLKKLAEQQQWALFANEYPRLRQLPPEKELTCYALQAPTASASASYRTDLRALWFAGIDLPASCAPLIDQLLTAQAVSEDEIRQRMRLLLENSRYTAADRLARALPGMPLAGLPVLQTVERHPQRYLDRLPKNFAATARGREMALFALARLARKDVLAAAQHLQKMHGKFSASERSYAWGQVAWWGAIRHQPEALDWYGLANAEQDAPLRAEQLEWQVRAALRARDWHRVELAIAQMPPEQADKPEWLYWRGRTWLATDRTAAARELFARIAGQASFYGNLASEELGQPIRVPPAAVAPTPAEVTAIGQLAGVRRALTLFRLGMRPEGVREWNWAMRGLTDRQLLAAAQLAQTQQVYDRAIYAAEKTQREHDFNLRYLAPFRETVLPQARQRALDGGWVFGLMRQESRFVINARSGVGAQGLMQLMPKTAAWVAKKMGMEGFHPSQVSVMDVNVALGTQYLAMVLEGLDNQPVLASAAYNAGPGRARRWRAERPLEGAIYAETIPFDETRDYVKKVMSNAVYYATLFENRPQSLKARLGVVAPRGGVDNIAGLP